MNTLNQGWIKLHRKLKETSFYKRSIVIHLFLHLLISANQKKNKFYWNGEEIEVDEGQFLTGRDELSKQTGISPQSIRTAMMVLKSTSTITIKSTNRFSLISILNWGEYQGSSTSKSTTYLTNNQPTTNQQLTTNNNDKNEKNITIAKILEAFRLIGKPYKVLPNVNVEKWLTVYTVDEICKAISFIPTNDYWREVMKPSILFRQRNDKGEVDQIGDLLNTPRPKVQPGELSGAFSKRYELWLKLKNIQPNL